MTGNQSLTPLPGGEGAVARVGDANSGKVTSPSFESFHKDLDKIRSSGNTDLVANKEKDPTLVADAGAAKAIVPDFKFANDRFTFMADSSGKYPPPLHLEDSSKKPSPQWINFDPLASSAAPEKYLAGAGKPLDVASAATRPAEPGQRSRQWQAFDPTLASTLPFTEAAMRLNERPPSIDVTRHQKRDTRRSVDQTQFEPEDRGRRGRRQEHREQPRGKNRGRRNDGTPKESTQSYENQDQLPPDFKATRRIGNEAPHNMKLMNAPSISAAQIDKILRENGSPAANEIITDAKTGEKLTFGQHLYKLGVQYGIDPAIPLAFFKMESTYGKFGVGNSHNSLGNIRAKRGYRHYDNFADGARDWYNLMRDNYIGKGKTTLGPALYKYAPPSENNTEGYIRNVGNDMRKWNRNEP